MHGRKWQEILFDAKSLSEYLLYGVYVEEILKPKNLEVKVERFHVGIWDHNELDEFLSNPGLFLEGHKNPHLTLVVQSNLHIPISEYVATLDRYLKLST